MKPRQIVIILSHFKKTNVHFLFCIKDRKMTGNTGCFKTPNFLFPKIVFAPALLLLSTVSIECEPTAQNENIDHIHSVVVAVELWSVYCQSSKSNL